MTTYEAHVTGRDGRWWAVWIPALGEDARTQAKRLEDVETEARDYIAVTLDVAPGSFNVTAVVDDLGAAHDVQERSDAIRAIRAQLDEAQRLLTEHTGSLVRDLRAAGVPMRDIASLAGVSFQRVSQLADQPPVLSSAPVSVLKEFYLARALAGEPIAEHESDPAERHKADA